jgi:hypothetical protein
LYFSPNFLVTQPRRIQCTEHFSRIFAIWNACKSVACISQRREPPRGLGIHDRLMLKWSGGLSREVDVISSG